MGESQAEKAVPQPTLSDRLKAVAETLKSRAALAEQLAEQQDRADRRLRQASNNGR